MTLSEVTFWAERGTLAARTDSVVRRNACNRPTLIQERRRWPWRSGHAVQRARLITGLHSKERPCRCAGPEVLFLRVAQTFGSPTTCSVNHEKGCINMFGNLRCVHVNNLGLCSQNTFQCVVQSVNVCDLARQFCWEISPYSFFGPTLLPAPYKAQSFSFYSSALENNSFSFYHL